MSNWTLSLALNYRSQRAVFVPPAHGLTRLFSISGNGGLCIKPLSFAQYQWWSRCQELSAFLLTDWFQMEHKSKSLSVGTLSPHTALQALLTLMGLLVSFAIPGVARNDPPTVPHLPPPKPLKISYNFFSKPTLLTLFSCI